MILFTGIGGAAVSAKFAAKTAKISIVSSAIGLDSFGQRVNTRKYKVKLK